MIDQSKIAIAGQLLCLDNGEYSDYCVTGFFVVLKDFNPLEELSKYIDANPEQKVNYCFESSAYLAELLAKGFLMEIEYKTLYLGSYNNHEDVSFT